MGSSNSFPTTLTPFHPPLGIHRQFCMHQPTTLVIHEAAVNFAGDVSIFDSNGVEVLRCKGKGFVGNRKGFTDTYDRQLFTLRMKLLSIHKTFVAEDGNGREVFVVKKQLGLRNRMVVTFTNAVDGSPIELDMYGDFRGRSVAITWNDRPVAHISRQHALALGPPTYHVMVAAGVDLVLIAAVCICFDEARKNGNTA
ncbi:hypothetical protein RQP46_001891 [Phenoliferia psychrophenolica]